MYSGGQDAREEGWLQRLLASRQKLPSAQDAAGFWMSAKVPVGPTAAGAAKPLLSAGSQLRHPDLGEAGAGGPRKTAYAMTVVCWLALDRLESTNLGVRILMRQSGGGSD